MVMIPDETRSLFSGTVHKCGDSYVFEIPAAEIEHGTLTPGETYRVAALDAPSCPEATRSESRRFDRTDRNDGDLPKPPVSEGEIRDVTVETVGEKGDGIAKVENGYVVIVPDAAPGDSPTIEIENVEENVAFGSVVREPSGSS